METLEYYKNLDLSDINYINQYGVECTELWEDIPDYNGNYKASNSKWTFRSNDGRRFVATFQY